MPTLGAHRFRISQESGPGCEKHNQSPTVARWPRDDNVHVSYGYLVVFCRQLDEQKRLLAMLPLDSQALYPDTAVINVYLDCLICMLGLVCFGKT
jgi:hypothetical protein